MEPFERLEEDLLGHPVQHRPIDVRIVGDDTREHKAPEYGPIKTYALVGTEAAQQILPQSSKRKEAYIWVNPSFQTGLSAGYVLIGDKDQVQNAQGGVFVSGNTIKIETAKSLWVIGDGVHSLCVTVLDQLRDE